MLKINGNSWADPDTEMGGAQFPAKTACDPDCYWTYTQRTHAHKRAQSRTRTQSHSYKAIPSAKVQWSYKRGGPREGGIVMRV